MTRTLELPEAVYAALRKAAEKQGLTPVDWIVTHLPRGAAEEQTFPQTEQTMADRFVGRLGRISGQSDHARNHEETFGEYLEQKRRAGRL